MKQPRRCAALAQKAYFVVLLTVDVDNSPTCAAAMFVHRHKAINLRRVAGSLMHVCERLHRYQARQELHRYLARQELAM